MQANNKISFQTILTGLGVLVLALGISLSGAKAQENPRDSAPSAMTVSPSNSSAKRYFVEFRSRSALSYGHTFLVHGRLGANGQVGKVAKEQVAGLHPATDSTVPWMIGHLIPVVSETGWSDGDNEDEYVTARYRINLTEAEYARVSAYIRSHQKNSPMWHAVLYNCNAWVGDVATFMGLKKPDSTMLYPEDYISQLASLNGAKASRPNPSKRSPLPGTSQQRTAPKPAAAKPAAKPQTAATPAAASQTVR